MVQSSNAANQQNHLHLSQEIIRLFNMFQGIMESSRLEYILMITNLTLPSPKLNHVPEHHVCYLMSSKCFRDVDSMTFPGSFFQCLTLGECLLSTYNSNNSTNRWFHCFRLLEWHKNIYFNIRFWKWIF